MWTNDLSNEDLIDTFKDYVRKGKYVADLEQEILDRFDRHIDKAIEEAYNEGYEYGKIDALDEYECNCECEKEKAQLRKLTDAIRNLDSLV